MVAETDNRGLVRAYMLIDVMPVLASQGGDGEGTIEDVSILAMVGILRHLRLRLVVTKITSG